MPKFLMQGSFTRDGITGLSKEGGTKRRQAVQQFFGAAGGKLETLYFAFGDTDVFAVAEFPDNVSAAAVSLAANAAGVPCQSDGANYPRRDGPGRTEE